MCPSPVMVKELPMLSAFTQDPDGIMVRSRRSNVDNFDDVHAMWPLARPIFFTALVPQGFDRRSHRCSCRYGNGSTSRSSTGS